MGCWLRFVSEGFLANPGGFLASGDLLSKPAGLLAKKNSTVGVAGEKRGSGCETTRRVVAASHPAKRREFSIHTDTSPSPRLLVSRYEHRTASATRSLLTCARNINLVPTAGPDGGHLIAQPRRCYRGHVLRFVSDLSSLFSRAKCGGRVCTCACPFVAFDRRNDCLHRTVKRVVRGVVKIADWFPTLMSIVGIEFTTRKSRFIYTWFCLSDEPSCRRLHDVFTISNRVTIRTTRPDSRLDKTVGRQFSALKPVPGFARNCSDDCSRRVASRPPKKI